jgi:molybdate transport system regulatory protein
MPTFPRVSLRIEFGPDLRIGPGKARLLELVAETGSIAAAARSMEMSYRRAWLLIEELNALFGTALVETTTGGSRGGGAVLTPLGERVIRTYRSIEGEADRLARDRFGALMERPSSARRSTPP